MASRTPVPSFVPALKGCVNILPDSIERDWGWVPSITSGDAAELIVQEPIIQEAIFDSCILSDVSIIETRKVEDHTVYVIQVVVGDCQWLVARRYREFDDLHEMLVKQYNVEKKLLPPKKVFRSKTEHYTSLRKVKLDEYLKELIRILPSPPLELLKFLQYPVYDVMSIIQQLSATFCNQSDAILSSSGGFISLTPVQVYCIQRRLQIPIEACSSYHDKDDITQLYDFFYQLQRLKIAPALNQTVTLTADVKVDLAPFKSLISLRLEALEVEYCVGLECLYTQLVCLEVYRSKSVLWEFLVVDSQPSDDVKGQSDINHQSSDDLDDSLEGQNGLTEDVVKKSCQWPQLQRLIFKYNNLEKIDESLRLLPNLVELDLSHNTIDTVENLSELSELTTLDLGYNQISRLDNLSSKLGNISKLSLANNQITSMEGLKKMFSLVYLNLNQNSIVDVKEVEHLSNLDCLEHLLLKGNPLTNVTDYRIEVFKLLPNTQKQLSLDGLEATTEELDAMGVQQQSSDNITDCMESPQRQQLQQIKRSPLSGKKMTTLSEDVDCVSLNRAAALKIKMETMRKEGGDKWLSMLNAEEEQKSHKNSPRKKQRKGKSSKKKKTEESDSCEIAEPEVLEVSALPPPPAPPPTPPPPFFQKCSLPLPMLDSDLMHKFFAHLQVTKQVHNNEVLMYVLWCSCVLWTSPDHEKDVTVLITSKSIHFLNITSTYKSSFSWETDNLPLVPSHSITYGELKQIVIGLEKQSLRLETSHLEDIIVLLIHNAEHTTSLAETLKAAMDGEQVKYNVYTSTELQKNRITGDVCSIIVLDETDECVLKRQLVQEDVIDQLSSQHATSYSTTLSPEESIQANIIATAAATNVCAYLCVSVLQEGSTEFCHRTLVITDEKLFMCDEDHLCWPPPLSMNVTPITNKVQVLQSELLSDVNKLEVCREPCLVGDTRNGVHEVVVIFSHTGEFGEKTETGWYFCLQGIGQLQSFVAVIESSPASVVPVGSITGLLWPELANRHPSVNMKTFSTVVSAKTVSKTPENVATLTTPDHDIKIDLNEVTFDKQEEYFHRYISQFPSKEKVKFTFSCMCIPFIASNTNIQTFVFVSTQAIYLLTDPQSMKQWIEDGGKCPFASHLYNNPEQHCRPLCFQYIAFQQLKDVNVGLFYQFFRISGGNSSSTFTFITQNYDITSKFLEALPSMRPREDSVDDSFTKLLTQYSIGQHKTDKRRPFSTPLPVNNEAEDVIICKTSYQEPNALLSTLSESPTGEDVMILKYMVIELTDDTTTITCSMVLTTHKLYIVGEDFIHWPQLSFALLPDSPQYSILKSCTLHNIVRVETKRRQACSFTIVCTEGKLKLPDNPPPLELSDDDSLISELMESIKIDKAVKRLSRSATASISAIRGLATWHLSVQSYEERERFLRVLATAYEDVKHEKLLVTAT